MGEKFQEGRSPKSGNGEGEEKKKGRRALLFGLLGDAFPSLYSKVSIETKRDKCFYIIIYL